MLFSYQLALIKKYKKLFIAIALSLSLALALTFGLNFSNTSVVESMNIFVNNYNYADAIITTDLLDDSVEELVGDLTCVKAVDSRLIVDLNAKIYDKNITLRAYTYDAKQLSSLYTYSINESADYPNVAVDYEFAKNNNVKAGDIITITFDSEDIDFCIGRIISSPDCISVVQNAYVYGNNAEFASVFMPEEFLLDSDYAHKCNQLLVFFEEWYERAEALKMVDEALKGYEVFSSTLFEDSYIQKSVDLNLDPIRSLSLFVPALFFCIVIGIVFLFLTQIIKQSRKDIGILRTLGYRISVILKIFSRAVLLVSLVACVLGTVLGYFLMKLVVNVYVDYLNIPIYVYSYDFLLYVVAILITLLSGQIAVYFSMNQIKKISPKEALGQDTNVDSKFDLKLFSLLSGLGVRLKYSLTMIIKNKKRFVFSSICISASVVLIFASIAFDDSKDLLFSELFEYRNQYDCQLFFKGELNDEVSKLMSDDCIKEYEELIFTDLELSFNGHVETITITGVEKGSKLMSIHDDKLKPLTLKDGLIIEKHTSDELGIKIGDVVSLNGYEITVDGICNEYAGRHHYLLASTLKKIADIDQYSYICNISDRASVAELVCGNDDFSYMVYTESLRNGTANKFSVYVIAVYIIIAFSCTIGFIIIYNMMQTGLLEQKKQLSVLRSIGFKVKDIADIWLVQTMCQLVLALVIGLSFGNVFSRIALSVISTSSREYPFAPYIRQYVLSVLIVFVYVLISHFTVVRSIKRWNLVENIKEKD